MDRRAFLGLSTGALLGLAGLRNEHTLRADLVIIGAGTGGVAAALAAATRGLRIILTDEMPWPGGQLTSQGVPPDEHPWIEVQGAPASYRSFRSRVRLAYARQWKESKEGLNPGACGVSRICHAPMVAASVLTGMLAEHGDRIHFLRRTEALSAEVDRDVVRSVQLRSLEEGTTFWVEAPVFIDATERGDLLPLAGVAYVTGSEGQAGFGEPHATPDADPANEQAFTWCAAVGFDPAFDPARSATPAGVPPGLLEAPEDYAFWRDFVPALSPSWTGRLLDLGSTHPITLAPRRHDFDPRPGARTERFNLWVYRRLQTAGRSWPVSGGVSLLNWPQNDYLGGRLIDVSVEERSRHEAAARQLTRSLIHWLRTEVERPDGGRGWPGLYPMPDILGTPDGLAIAPYIRESRRIRARTTVHELHVGKEAREKVGLVEAEHFPDSIGVGYYRIDIHPSTGGDNYIDVDALPFEIPLGALVPLRIENLIAGAKNIGTTHITNGCYRLHPVEWSIGEAAGALAAQCVMTKATPHDIHRAPHRVAMLQADLTKGGAHLRW